MTTRNRARKFYLIVDTETTAKKTVFDFSAIIVDKSGNIHSQLAVVVEENISAELFSDNSTGFFGKHNLSQRKAHYVNMCQSGTRVIASVAHINNWLSWVNHYYNPELTAYNLAFDMGACRLSGIDLNIFSKSFCLWQAAIGNLTGRKYFNFVLDNHYFNNRTALGNLTIQTNAQVMAHYVTGLQRTEPHTALEDARDFELPILLSVIKRANWRKRVRPYNWADFVVRLRYKAK